MQSIRDGKNIIIGGLLVAIIVMAVGYAAFATTLNINGSATIEGNWNVQITDIQATSVVGTANAGTPSFTATSATFDARFLKPGDTVTYTITIENKGTIDAKYNGNTLAALAGGSDAITFTHTEPSDINAGQSTTATVTIAYDASTETLPSVLTKSISGTYVYVQK